PSTVPAPPRSSRTAPGPASSHLLSLVGRRDDSRRSVRRSRHPHETRKSPLYYSRHPCGVLPAGVRSVGPMLEGTAPTERRMTEEEFVAWCDEDTNAEWVDGLVIVKEPVSGEHDQIAWWLRTLLQHYVEHRGLGLVSGPQFCVRLPRRPSRREPDVVFVAAARRDVFRPNHAEGPPDLLTEVVSPDSQSRDRREKYFEYEAAGIPEYWIADPLSRTLEAYTLLD